MDIPERDPIVAKATEIIQQTLKEGTATLSPADVSTLVAVTVRDIVQVCHDDAARLTKVEAQTAVLADAVLAITESAAAVAPGLHAVKAERAKN